MATYTVTGTSAANTWNPKQRVWTDGEVTAYNNYDFEFGKDALILNDNGTNVSYSSIASFQAAMLEIEATGLDGYSAIGTTYTISGSDITFSFGTEGKITLKGMASVLDLGPSNIFGAEGTNRADTITTTTRAQRPTSSTPGTATIRSTVAIAGTV